MCSRSSKPARSERKDHKKPVSSVRTPTDAATESLPTPIDDEIWLVKDVANYLRTNNNGVYNLTRSRATARYPHPLPVMRLPCGLRFLKSDVIAWVKKYREDAKKGRDAA